MEDGFSLSSATVGIAGLGLMGGSLALALKGRCRCIVGTDTDRRTVKEACQRRVVSRADSDPARVLPGSDLIILAAPVPAILELIVDLPEIMPTGCIVIDVGSAKRSIVSAMNRLPERFEPIGGHPLCGKENVSFANAEASLYQGATFFLTPLERTTRRALSAARQIVEAVGAKPAVVSAEEHDQFMAQTSHMPFLLSSALALAVSKECAEFAGPGFRSMSRLAATPASMMLGVLQSNRDNVLEALYRVQNELAEIEELLRTEDFAALEEIVDEAKNKHQALVRS